MSRRKRLRNDRPRPLSPNTRQRGQRIRAVQSPVSAPRPFPAPNYPGKKRTGVGFDHTLMRHHSRPGKAR